MIININKSKINGLGVIALKSFPESYVVSVVIFGFNRSNVPEIDGYGKYINHQYNSNCKLEPIFNKIYLITKRPIEKGEELTINYNKYAEKYNVLPAQSDYIELKEKVYE